MFVDKRDELYGKDVFSFDFYLLNTIVFVFVFIKTTMLLGNQREKEYIGSCIAHHQSQSLPLFIVISWVSGIWKSSFVLEYAQSLFWSAFMSDFLWIRDCSQELGKNHSLQIETPSMLKTIPLVNGEFYENRGVREINHRLQQSSLSGRKMVLIENLERMTGSAMNAFLKTCEEPLANRYLIATVAHHSLLLPTIVSRAVLVNFSPLSSEEMYSFLTSHFSFLSEDMQRLVVEMSRWRPGLALELLKKIQANSELTDVLSFLASSSFLSQSPVDLLPKLKTLSGLGCLEFFLEGKIASLVDQGKYDQAQSWIKVKKMLAAHISEENLLRYWLLSSSV